MRLEPLLESKEILVVCGSGGVGKTTTAAALAATVAIELGGKVLVVTVDPARRLADALGVEGVGNEERQVPPVALRAALSAVRSDPGAPGAARVARGELWAAMLDTKQSWDALVRRHAPDPRTAARILGNPLYQNVSGKFVQSHDYIAMERLYELHASGTYDLIVVDTPPTRNALDFLEAPARMAEFFSSRLLRMLTVPYRSRVVNLASRPFYQIADRILGSQFLEDIAEFFILFQTMYPGFVDRATAVERLLRDPRTGFVVVSTLEAAPLREAEYFIELLESKRYDIPALVLNRVLPSYLLDHGALERAGRLCAPGDGELAAGLAERVGADGAQLQRVLCEVGANFANFSVVARREAEQRSSLSALGSAVVAIPEIEQDICDLSGLLRVGVRL